MIIDKQRLILMTLKTCADKENLHAREKTYWTENNEENQFIQNEKLICYTCRTRYSDHKDNL